MLEETRIIVLWESIGAKVNVVGSFKRGLIMKNRDIDFHIYTDGLSVSDSFAVTGMFAQKHAVKEIQYKNLINTEEECMECSI